MLKTCGDYLLAVEEQLTKHGLAESQLVGIRDHLTSLNRRAQQFGGRSAAASATSPAPSPSSPSSSSASSSASSSTSSLSNSHSPVSSPSATPTTSSSLSPPPPPLSNSSQRSMPTHSRHSSRQSSQHRQQQQLVDDESQSFVSERVNALNKAYEMLGGLAASRRHQLEQRRELCSLCDQCDEEMLWLSEKLHVLGASAAGGELNTIGSDLSATRTLLAKHEQLESELRHRLATRIDKLLLDAEQQQQQQLQNKAAQLRKKSDEVRSAAARRRLRLEDALVVRQFAADATEIETWLGDKAAALVPTTAAVTPSLLQMCVEDARAQLQRHVRLHEEIVAYGSSEVERLRQLTDVLVGGDKPVNAETTGEQVDFDDEEEVEEEEDMEEEEITVVKALYAFESERFSMSRGDLMQLCDKTNADWWFVVMLDDEESNLEAAPRQGYAPANYLQQVAVKSPQHSKKQQQQQPSDTLKACQLRRKATSVRRARPLRHTLAEMSRTEMREREREIARAYASLVSTSVERHVELDTLVAYARWRDKHAELCAWIGDKLAELDTVNATTGGGGGMSWVDSWASGGGLDSAKRVYRAFCGDFAANQGEYAALVELADALLGKRLTSKTGGSGGGGMLDTAPPSLIIKKQFEVSKQWQRLLDLKRHWDEACKAMQCIDAFNAAHEDALELIQDKMRHSTTTTTTTDSMTLATVEKSVSEASALGAQVSALLPQEAASVRRKMSALDERLRALRACVEERECEMRERAELARFEAELGELRDAMRLVRHELDQMMTTSTLTTIDQCERMQFRCGEIDADMRQRVEFRANLLADQLTAAIGKKKAKMQMQHARRSATQLSADGNADLNGSVITYFNHLNLNSYENFNRYQQNDRIFHFSNNIY